MKIDEYYHLYGTKDEIIFEKIPSVESERKKGKWVFDKEKITYDNGLLIDKIYWFSCSSCGFRTEKKSNFCPNCGADMREVEE